MGPSRGMPEMNVNNFRHCKLCSMKCKNKEKGGAHCVWDGKCDDYEQTEHEPSCHFLHFAEEDCDCGVGNE